VDLVNSRDKRIFNDQTGLKAAKNEKKFLLQVYLRDTGEIIADLSMPIYVNDKHWGALRVGLTPEMFLDNKS
jgi:methyl-accepting chemotaxis protein